MRDEAATSFTAEGQALGPYADALLTRFANRTLEHRLSQIASDGSQKSARVGCPRWRRMAGTHLRR